MGQQQKQRTQEQISKFSQEIQLFHSTINKKYEHNPKCIQFISYILSCILQQLKQGKLQKRLSPEKLFPWKYSFEKPIPSPICSKMFQANNSNKFTCYDCEITSNTVYCYQCFSKSNHQGHRFIQYSSGGGQCDCGDPGVRQHCPVHQHNQEYSEETASNLRESFIQEIKLSLFIYFYLIQCEVSYQLSQFIKNIGKLIKQSFEVSILFAEIFTSKFDEFQTKINKQYTFLQHTFRMDRQEEQNEIAQVILMLFPVQSFQKKVAIEYHKKANYEYFSCQHPLANIHYQFITCSVLLRHNQIFQTQIKPLVLYLEKDFTISQRLKACIRYFTDCWTLTSYNSKQYWIKHLPLININEMITFTQFTLYNLNNVSLDKIFLQLFLKIGKCIQNNKDVIARCMQQLFAEIRSKTIDSYSFIQENIFGLFTFIYFEGNLEQIKQLQPTTILDLLDIQIQNIDAIIKQLIKKGLKHKIKVKNQKIQDFLAKLNKQHIRLFKQDQADLLYFKALFMFNFTSRDYHSIIIQCLSQLILQKQPVEDINYLLCFVTKILSHDLQQIILSNFYDFAKTQKVISFYARFLKTFQYLQPKQIRLKLQQIIDSQQLIQEFIKNHTRIQNKKYINVSEQIQQLQYFLFRQVLSLYNLNFEFCKKKPIKQSILLQKFKEFTIFDGKGVNLLLQKSNQIIKKQITDNKNNNKTILKDLQIFFIQIIKLFFILEDKQTKQQIKQHLTCIFTNNLQQSFNSDVIIQIKLIFSQQQILAISKNNHSQTKIQKSQLFLKKKAENMEKMKKNNELILQKANKQRQQPQLDIVETDQCVYCKSKDKKEVLYLLAYCNITNLFESSIIYTDSFHIFFKSCHHKIHQTCYEKYLEETNQFTHCLLCKANINIIIPEISKIQKQQFKLNAIKQFLDKIFVTISQSNTQYEGQLQSFNKFHEENSLNMIVECLLLEIIFKSKFNYQGLYKPHFIAFRELIQLMNSWTLDQVEQALQLVIKKWSQRAYEQLLFDITQFGKYLHDKWINKKSHEQIETHYQQIIQIINIYNLLEKNDLSKINQYNQPLSIQIIDKRIMKIDMIPQDLSGPLKIQNCPKCKRFTKIIFKCLKCQFTTCRNCFPQKKLHFDGNAYFLIHHGIIVFMLNRQRQNLQLYENYFGQCYTESKETIFKLQKYKLNKQKLKNVYKIILEYDINNALKNN